MNTFKRFFALILTLCMVLSYVPVGAQAAETGPVSLSGTPTTPAGVSGVTEPFPVSMFTTDMQMATAGHYRIPVIVTMNDGTLVAVADVRWQAWNPPDDCGNIDTMVSYSKDNGATWSYTFANYYGGENPYGDVLTVPTYIDPGLGTDGNKLYMIVDLYPGQTINDNCTNNSSTNIGYDAQGRLLLRANGTASDTGYYLDKYDDGTGKTYYKIYTAEGVEQDQYIVDGFFNLYEKNDQGTYVHTRNLFEYSTTSFMPVMTSHLYLTTSEDGGKTWSEPTMINPSVRPGVGENCYLVNPGRGIYTKDGVLVFGGYRYPNQHANLMFSTDGGVTWNKTALTSDYASEHEIVELNDGTLRMFARHNEDSADNLKYIDWVPVKTNGVVTDYVAQPAKFVDVSAHKNCNLSAISYSGTYQGYQVILVSCPTGGSRANGKVYAFYVDDDQNMVKIGEKAISSSAFSYSSLTEQADGKIALLYENGDAGNIHYLKLDISDILSQDITLDEDTNIFVDGVDNSASVSVQVPVSSNVTHIHTQQNTNVSGINGTYTAYDVVLCTDAVDSCTAGLSCANTYTNAATVTIPISAETAGKHLKGFVVNDNGTLTYVEKVEVRRYPNGNYTVSFKAPHFSTVGVKVLSDEEIATDRKTIDIVVGQTHTEYLNEEEYTGSKNDTTANVAWGVVDHVVTYLSAIQGDNNGFGGTANIDIAECLYTFTAIAADTYVYVASAKDEAGNKIYLKPYNVADTDSHNTDVPINITLSDGVKTNTVKMDGTDPDSNKSGGLHFHADDTNPYWNQCGSDSTDKHDILLYRAVRNGETSSTEIPGYIQIAGKGAIEDGGKYLVVAKSVAGDYYVMVPTTSTQTSRSQIAKVTGTTAQKTVKSTEITFQGLAVGQTTVLVGTTLYTVNVTEAKDSKDVELLVGKTHEETLPVYIPSGSNAGTASADIANVTWVGTAASAQALAATNSSFNAGTLDLSACEYEFYDKEGDNKFRVKGTTADGNSAWAYFLTPGKPHADSQDMVTFTAGTQDGTFKLNATGYLHFGDNASNPLAWNRCRDDHAEGDAMYRDHDMLLYRKARAGETSSALIPGYVQVLDVSTIQNNEKVLILHEEGGQYYLMRPSLDTNSWYSHVAKLQSVPASTTITITGVAKGDTSVVVGDTTYKIHVVYEEVEVKVELNVDEVEEDVIVGSAYSDADVTVQDSTIANVTAQPRTETGYVKGNEITAQADLVVGKQYVLSNDFSSKNLTNVASGSNLTLGGGLDSISENAVWTLVAYDPATGNAKLQDSNGKYLTIGVGSANVVAGENEVKLIYRDDGRWNITEDGHYLNNVDGSYFEVQGWGNCNKPDHEYCQWSIYEVSLATKNTTNVVITGLKAGTTTAKVGHVTYTIVVSETAAETVDVVLNVGQTKNFTISGYKYATGTVADPTKVNMTINGMDGQKMLALVAPGDVVDGKSYLIATAHGSHAVVSDRAHSTANNLAFGGDVSVTNGELWTFTAQNGGYLIHQGNNYLNLSSSGATVTSTAQVITVGSGAITNTSSFVANGHYMNNHGNSSERITTWTDNDNGSAWYIYEIVDNPNSQRTDVSFEGLEAGTTTAKVGHVTYNITVKEIVKNVEIFVGETWTDSINGISENGTYNNDHVSATWKDIGIREGVGQLLNANDEITSSIELSEAELTFTLSNGKYKIATAGGKFLDISGDPFDDPFDDAFEEANDYVSLSFGADGAVRIVNLEGHYLQVYTGNGAPEWAWKTAHTGTITDDAFAFYIYEAVENARDSSAEIPGYRKITSADEITSGESYLVAFVKDGTYYVAHYTGTSGANANMARISTTQTGAFTDVSIVGNHVGAATVKFNGVTYNVTVKPFEKNFSLEIKATQSYKAHECVTQAQVDEFNAKHGTVVTAELKDGHLVFTGKAEGSVKKYLLGDTLYTITVTPVLAHPNDTKYVGGQQGTQGQGQKITGLIISNETIYDLNLDASMDGKTIRWDSSDETLFTVDQNGTVTTKGKGGDGYIYIYDGGDEPYQIIPIHVIETDKTGNMRVVDVYNSEVINCTAYYTLNEGEIHEFPKGYQIFVNHTMSETDLITFYATPDEGHALTYINSVGGSWFHPVVNKEGTDYLVDGEHNDGLTMRDEGYISLHDQLIAHVANNSGAADVDTIHAMLDKAVALQIDGAFFFSRRGDGSDGNIQTTTTFVAEKLPTVDKSVNGILGTSGLQVDFKTYSDGMYAEVGQHVYFNVSVEEKAPLFWERAMQSNKAYTPAADYAGVVVDTSGFVVTKNDDGVWERAVDAEGNPYAPAEGAKVLMVDSQGYVLEVDTNGRPIPALRYTASNLFDNLKGAYFYTKKLDRDDGKYEGFLEPSLQKTAQDITAELNRTWTAEELAAGRRVLEYFVVYQIQPSDLNQNITNTVDLEYVYTTVYSDGSGESDSHADASLVVLGQSFGDVVIDFGLPFVKTGLTGTTLPGISPENYKTFEANTNAAQGGCKFGTVEITYDAASDTYNLIYTPKAILTTYDVIYIMDANNKLVNYIRVRPASTVFYEESFAVLDNAIGGVSGWSAVAPITGAQEYEDVGCVKHNHDNFGYDKKYAGEVGMSNRSKLISSNSGDTATFTFNGTGFDIYANCDPDSSVVAVLVYRMRSSLDDAGNATQTEELTKFFQVATKIKPGATGATEYAGVTYADGSVIVSVTDLEHGTYKVVIRHTKKVDGTDTRKFYLDGFRIYNTLKDGDQYYPINEKRVIFTELRDEVLFAAGVKADSTQIYNRESNYVSTTAPGATVAFLRDSENAVLKENVQDWLNNGPKNEIWMKSSDALVFTLYAGDPDTQAGAIANAQLGMKAPTGKAVVLITLSYDGTRVADKKYTITSATDMFYELPETDSGMINGLTVTVTVEEGMVSITKLKANVYEGGVATVSPLSMMDDLDIASALNVLYPTNDDNGETTDPSDPDDGTTTDPTDPDDGETTDPSDPDDGETTDPSDPSDDDLPDAGVDVYKDTVNRIFGENRFETAFKVADELKAVLGIEKFKNIIIASGTNFADALSGTYLASVKNAPILLSYNEVYNDMVREYIAENLAEDGTVYILGGNAAVPYTMDLELIADGITIKRLAGADRFATNLAILTEAGVKGGEILVCTGSNFADSLSASATGKPILLVYNESGELSVAQKLYLTMMDRANFTIIGGEKAISAELEKAVSAYGVTNRLAGANRFETSVAIAEAYFTDPQDLVLAYAGNYPDGLCGGALAYAINAPLVLTMSGYETEADAYADASDVQGGVVLGGSGLISDDSVVEIFGLEKPEEIIVK